jgi:hypothetical protein
VIVYKFSNFVGVYLTGRYQENILKRTFQRARIKTADGSIEDNIPEDMSMAISTSKGINYFNRQGGHAGIINDG